MRTLSILGDSYSTFLGHVPEGQDLYYPHQALGVTDVSHTWWHQLMAMRGLELLVNDSWSGATVCTTVRPEHPVRAAFVKRMEATLNGANQPDLIILFGGTNDSWTDAPLGSVQYDHWTDETDQQVLPALCHMVAYVQAHNPAARLVFVANCDIKDEIVQAAKAACAHYGVTCVALHDIDKNWGHPTPLGMRQIAEQIAAVL